MMKQSITVQGTLVLAIMSIAMVGMAADAHPKCQGSAHTKHTISVEGGTAVCLLAKLFEPNQFCLVNSNGTFISGTPFHVSPQENAEWSVILEPGADFDMAYALTCTQHDHKTARSPKTIFVISAEGPADPKIETVDLYGAKGSWNSTGTGEDYLVQFPTA